MPKLIETPKRVQAAGNKPKVIDEYVGCVNTGNHDISIAHMRSPQGWHEPGQRPTFSEITVVVRGTLRVEHKDGVIEVAAGQAVQCAPNEWVRYSTPFEGGAEYFAICTPAFTPETAFRDS